MHNDYLTHDHNDDGVDRRVDQVMEQAIDALRHLGAEVIERHRCRISSVQRFTLTRH